MIKYARVEQILEIKMASERLPFDYDAHPGDNFSKFAALNNIEESEDGFLYVRCRAISSRVNKNNDGWPSAELKKSFKTFIGRPIFVDHNNDNPDRARGVIVDSRLHEDDDKTSAFDPYYATAPDNHKPPTWIELLLEVDAKTYPRLAKAIRKGDIDAVSMGANIEASICSVCSHTAKSPIEYCQHISSKGAEFEVTSANGEKIMKKSYEDCHDINFFEISFVFDPADPTALISEKADHRLSAYGQKGHGEVCTMCGHHGVSLGSNCPSCNKSQTIRTITPNKPMTDTHPSMAQKSGTTKEALQQSPQTVDDGQTQIQNPQERELNYIPQGDLVTRPSEVDTLRKDTLCPWCHSDNLQTDAQGAMKCPSCSWVQPPHPLDNPDLTQNPEENPQENNQNQQETQQVTFFSPQSNTLISEMKWETLSNTIRLDNTAAVLPKKKVLNPSVVTKTDDPQTAKVIADQKTPVTSKEEKVDKMEDKDLVTKEDEDKKESKLLVAFSIADELVALGAIEDTNKLAFVAKFEEKTSEAQDTAKEIIEIFKEANFTKTVTTKTAGLTRVPKMAGLKSVSVDDTPFEAIFM